MKNISVYFLSSLFMLTSLSAWAQKKSLPKDSLVYQGINFKIDIGNCIYELATSKTQNQSYEALLNVDLQHTFFPTLEVGYAQANATINNSAQFAGKGFFGRVGLDLSALKKRRADNMLLVGIRIGTAFQRFSTSGLSIIDPYWQTERPLVYDNLFRADVWGEVCAGVQVQVVKNLNMGFYLREKILITRGKEGQIFAYYIPGFGYKKDSNFGFNYYIGYHF